MNILDEDIPETQRERLQVWRIRVRQIGHDIGRKGMLDDEIIPLLHHLQQPTLFSRDDGFYGRHRCHTRYCIIYLNVAQYEVATFVRRVLRHPTLVTRAKRMGTVVRVTSGGFHVWHLHAASEETLEWM